jgi:membrane protein YqaA with SNARE-associated domain
MFIEKYRNFLRFFSSRCRSFVRKIWFAPILTILALLDVFLIFIPADGIMISSSMILPKRWLSFALHVAIGSSLGALLLVIIVQHYGPEQLTHFFPNINQSEIWKWTLHFFHQYGIIVLFIVGLMPFSQQPVLILSALSDHSLLIMGAAILLSRIIKFSVMAYTATHAPKFLSRFWGKNQSFMNQESN